MDDEDYPPARAVPGTGHPITCFCAACKAAAGAYMEEAQRCMRAVPQRLDRRAISWEERATDDVLKHIYADGMDVSLPDNATKMCTIRTEVACPTCKRKFCDVVLTVRSSITNYIALVPECPGCIAEGR